MPPPKSSKKKGQTHTGTLTKLMQRSQPWGHRCDCLTKPTSGGLNFRTLAQIGKGRQRSLKGVKGSSFFIHKHSYFPIHAAAAASFCLCPVSIFAFFFLFQFCWFHIHNLCWLISNKRKLWSAAESADTPNGRHFCYIFGLEFLNFANLMSTTSLFEHKNFAALYSE